MQAFTATTLCALLLACALPRATAGMYRWVDENGVTVYSQLPPPSGAAVGIRVAPAPSPAEQAAAHERLKGVVEQSFDAAEASKQAAEEQSKKAQEQASRAGNCQAARQNLDTLQNLGARMVRMPDGRYLRLGEDEVAQRRHQAQAQIDELCR